MLQPARLTDYHTAALAGLKNYLGKAYGFSDISKVSGVRP